MQRPFRSTLDDHSASSACTAVPRRQWPRLFRGVLIFAFAILADTTLALRAAEVPVALTIDAVHPGSVIGERFAGLSYEVTSILPVNGVHYFRADNASLVSLFRTLGLRSLRIGGNTSDRNVRELPTKADWDDLFAFAKAADVKVIYCLRLHEGDPAIAAATVKYITDHYAPWVDTFSIGQEPSAYPVEKIDTRPAGERMGAAVEKFPYAKYRDQWKVFADAIVAAVPDVKFCGPCVHNNAEWARRFIEDYGKGHNVALISEHLYPGGAAGKLPSAQVGRDRMLSGEFLGVYQKLHDGFVPAAKALGLPYRLEEVNSYFNGGAQDASNTYSAALWGLEFMYWWAAHDASGLNFHTGDRVSMNNEVQAPRYAAFLSSADGFSIRPLAYAFKAFALGGHGRIVPATLENSGSVNLTAYATVADDKTVTVTIINKEHGDNARDAEVTIHILNTGDTKNMRAEAAFLRTEKGDVAATTAISFGNSEIDSSGRWSGAWQPVPAQAADGSLQLKVPAAEAVVIRFQH